MVFIQRQKVICRLDGSTPSGLQLDGEIKQIECFNYADYLKLVDDHNVIVGKPPASTTHTTQPCDVGNCFKASKTFLAGVCDSHIKYRDSLRGDIATLLHKHNDSYPKGKQLS